MQPRSLGVVICYGLLLALLPASAETKPEDATLALQTIDDFHSVEQQGARKPINDVDASYRSKLEKFQETARAAGNLKSVLAAKQAITDLDAGRPPVVSDDAEVAAIQKSYMVQRQKAAADSEKTLAKVDQDYLASLKKLVVELTKAGQIDQAQQVQAKADGLTAKLNPKAATAPAVDGEALEIWKKKALEEFPELVDPQSKLSKKVQSLKELKKSTPRYFSNSQWPYLLAKEASQSLPAKRYPPEATLFNGKRYFVYEDKCSWKTARFRCEKQGGQLVVIHDKATQTFVTNLANGRSVWLGATDEETDGEWRWVDGTKMNFKQFNRGEPNAGNNEHMAVMTKAGGGDWSDISGTHETNYVCEWPD